LPDLTNNEWSEDGKSVSHKEHKRKHGGHIYGGHIYGGQKYGHGWHKRGQGGHKHGQWGDKHGQGGHKHGQGGHKHGHGWHKHGPGGHKRRHEGHEGRQGRFKTGKKFERSKILFENLCNHRNEHVHKFSLCLFLRVETIKGKRNWKLEGSSKWTR